jgi:hypothetical protein
VALCNYPPACPYSLAARSQSTTRGNAELCAAAQQTARLTIKSAAVPSRRTLRLVRPRPKAPALLPYLSLATCILLPHHFTPDLSAIQSP